MFVVASQQLMPLAVGGQLFWQSRLAVQTGTHLELPPWHCPPVQVCVPVQGTHAVPPTPHAEVALPPRQVVPLQHPEQDDESQTQLPAEQRCPMLQVPVAQMVPQPSLAPHALPVHDGTHALFPQRFGPLAPHFKPAGQAPQSMMLPQWPAFWPQ